MKKFIVHSRNIPGQQKTDVPTIVEVDGEFVTALEDPSITFLPQGEFKFSIIKPVFLHEAHEVKFPDGAKKNIMTPSVYHSFAIFDTEVKAREVAEHMVKDEFEFSLRKNKISSYTEEEVQVKCSEIRTMMLS